MTGYATDKDGIFDRKDKDMRPKERDLRRQKAEIGTVKFVKSAQQSLTFALFSSDDLLHS